MEELSSNGASLCQCLKKQDENGFSKRFRVMGEIKGREEGREVGGV